MTIKVMLETFERWREQSMPMALVTVVKTHGSTYAKAGTQMLLGPNEAYTGLVSGGCLEGDLMDRARPVIKDGASLTVFYDMRDEEEDLLWGLGVGCNGAMRLLLQPLNPDNGFEPMAGLARAMRDRVPTTWAAVVKSDDDRAPVGAWLMAGGNGVQHHGLAGAAMTAVEAACRDQGDGADTRAADLGGAPAELFVGRVPFTPRVLVLGAGPDVVPVLRMMEALGWQVIVRDHRPAYIQRITAAGATDAVLTRPEEIADTLPACEAAVIMSHHLKTDEGWLRCLAATDTPFIALLGPPARRERLLDAMGDLADVLRPRVHGPAGLDLGATSAETIALSIVGQVQAALAGRPGGFIYQP